MAFADPATGRNIVDSGRGTRPGTVTLAEAVAAIKTVPPELYEVAETFFG